MCRLRTWKTVKWPSEDKKGDCSRFLPEVRRLIGNLWSSLDSVGLKPITSDSTRNAWVDRKFLQTIVFLEQWIIVSALCFGEFRRFERGAIASSLFTESYTFTDSMKIMRQINIVSIKIILLLSILRISQGTRDLRGNIFIISCLFLFWKDFSGVKLQDPFTTVFGFIFRRNNRGWEFACESLNVIFSGSRSQQSFIRGFFPEIFI